MHRPRPPHFPTCPSVEQSGGGRRRRPAASVARQVTRLGACLAFLLSACEGTSPDRLPDGEGAVQVVLGKGVRGPAFLPPLSVGVLGVSDVLRADDGWWLLDSRSVRLHRVGPDFQVRWSVGGRGNAPGEFRAPRALLQRGDSVVVVELDEHPTLHLFDPGGRFIRKEIILTPECANFRLGNVVLQPDGSYLVGGTCLRAAGGPAMGPAVVRYEPGRPGVVVASELRPAGPGRMNPDAAFLVRAADRIWMGRAYDNCFRPLPEGEGGSGVPAPAPEPLCIEPWQVVPLPLERIAEGMPDPSRAALLPSVLGGIDHLPLMDRVFPHREGIVLRRISGLESRELVLLGFDGSTRVLGEALPERSWVVGDSILVAWDGLEGSHVETRPFPSR
jgi:hypothetical protein